LRVTDVCTVYTGFVLYDCMPVFFTHPASTCELSIVCITQAFIKLFMACVAI